MKHFWCPLSRIVLLLFYVGCGRVHVEPMPVEKARIRKSEPVVKVELEMLKSSVLLVLYENKDGPYAEAGCLLQPKAISEQLGIQRPSEVSAQAYV